MRPPIVRQPSPVNRDPAKVTLGSDALYRARAEAGTHRPKQSDGGAPLCPGVHLLVASGLFPLLAMHARNSSTNVYSAAGCRPQSRRSTCEACGWPRCAARWEQFGACLCAACCSYCFRNGR